MNMWRKTALVLSAVAAAAASAPWQYGRAAQDPLRFISGPSSDTAQDNDVVIAWKSGSGLPKTQTIPGCGLGANGRVLEIVDEQGDAASNNITVTPQGGTINGVSSFVIGSTHGSLIIRCDGAAANWVNLSYMAAPNGSQKQTQINFRLSQNQSFANTGATGQTISVLSNIEAPATWIRLIHYNDQTAATWTITNASVAPTSMTGIQADDSYNPYDSIASQDNALWATVTYNNGGVDADQFSQGSGSTKSITVGIATPDSGQPSFVFSDWIPVQPVSRIDGGPGALLITHIYCAGFCRYEGGPNTSGSSVGQGLAGFQHPVGWNRNWAGVYFLGQNVAQTPWGGTANGIFNFGEPAIQYILAGKGVTILGVGDSITAGNQSTGAIYSFCEWAAAQLTTATLPVNCFKEGFSGRTSADFFQNGYNDIKHFKPQAMIIQCWSGNDTQTNAAALTAFTNCMALAQYAASQGTYPILTTANPRYCTASSNETNRVYSNGLVRGAGKAGFDVLDLDTIWGTGTSPNCYQPQYLSDGVHPNDAGYQAAGAILKTILINKVLPH